MITSRLFQTVSSFMQRLLLVEGRVAIGATGAVGTQTGKGFSVARTGAGLYTVTVSGAGTVYFLNANAWVTLDNNAGFVARVKAISNTARTFAIVTAATSALETPADPTSGAILHISARLNRNSNGL